jgi:hypothetical protein
MEKVDFIVKLGGAALTVRSEPGVAHELNAKIAFRSKHSAKHFDRSGFHLALKRLRHFQVSVCCLLIATEWL